MLTNMTKKTHLAFGVPQTRFDLVFQANNNNKNNNNNNNKNNNNNNNINNNNNNNNSFHSFNNKKQQFPQVNPSLFLVNVGTPCADSFPSWWPFVHLPEPVVWHHHQNHDDHPRWRWSIPSHLGEHWQLGLKARWLKSQLGISLDLFRWNLKIQACNSKSWSVSKSTRFTWNKFLDK